MKTQLETLLGCIESQNNSVSLDDESSLNEMNEIWGTNLGSDDCDVDDIPGAR